MGIFNSFEELVSDAVNTLFVKVEQSFFLSVRWSVF